VALIEFSRWPANALEVSFLVPYYRAQRIYGELFNLRQMKISMVHEDVLALMYHLASNSIGGILELGPYVGGSTTALGWGKRQGGKSTPIIAVDRGGAYEHPTHGTDDIIRDLKRNLSQFGVAADVTVIAGDSRDPAVVDQVHVQLGALKVALFCIDTDGNVGLDFRLYQDLLMPGCYLVLDDYFSPGAPQKAGLTRDSVRVLEEAGLIESLGVYGWGTWVGRLRT
jgi:cephalosporin hydroxylase